MRFVQFLRNQISKPNHLFEQLNLIIYYDPYLRSPIAILTKAEVMAAKFNAERWSESRHLWSKKFDLDEWKDNESFFKIKIGNKDWKLKIVDGEKD